MTGCGFVGLSKAGLVNHVRQRHGRLARLKEKCLFVNKISVSKDFQCIRDSVRQTRANAGVAKGYLRPALLSGEGRGGGGGG